MKLHDGYYQDLALATLLRVWIYLGILSIIAVVSFGCSTRTEVAGTSQDDPAARGLLDRGEANQTRNHIPQGGCDEKSDSSHWWSTDRRQ